MTATQKFIVMNAAILGMLLKLAVVDRTPLWNLVITAVVSFIVLNLVLLYGVRWAAKRKASNRLTPENR
jgi:hypothetical protein